MFFFFAELKLMMDLSHKQMLEQQAASDLKGSGAKARQAGDLAVSRDVGHAEGLEGTMTEPVLLVAVRN